MTAPTQTAPQAGEQLTLAPVIELRKAAAPDDGEPCRHCDRQRDPQWRCCSRCLYARVEAGRRSEERRLARLFQAEEFAA